MSENLVAVGRVGKPHGIHGWVTVMPTTDEPERRFAVGATVLLDGEPREILDARLGRPLSLQLSGVDDREQAETLRGSWLYVDVAGEVSEDDDEFYDHELVGLIVQMGGSPQGTVKEILHLPGHDLIVVTTAAGREVLVPFVEDIVPAVDLAAGTIDVKAVEGLFDDED